MMSDPLAGDVRRLFGNLLHAGRFESELGTEAAPGSCLIEGEAGRVERGTRVRFGLLLRGERITGVRYRAYGCPHTLAVCEWLSQALEAGQLGTIGGAADWSRALGVPTIKLGRLLVVEDALNAALQQLPRGG